jgi:uncharacterized protein YjgD (DUF1641 family)
MEETRPTGGGERNDAVLQALGRLEDRLSRLEEKLEATAALTAQAPAVIGAVGDTFDDAVAHLAHRGVDVDERLHAALRLLERVSEPRTLAGLQQLVDMAESMPGMVAAAGDTLDQHIAGLAARGVDVDQRLRILSQVAERLTAPEALEAVCKVLGNIEALTHVLESGILDECAIATVGCAARALADTRAEGIEPVGMLGALRALSDPGVQRSLGVAVEFGRRFGSAMEAQAKKSGGGCN